MRAPSNAAAAGWRRVRSHSRPRVAQKVSGALGDEVVAGRPEAHHDHVGAARHAQPLKGLFEDETADSLADGLSTSDGSGTNGVRIWAVAGCHSP